MDLDQHHVNRLTQVAIQLAARVRDEDPQDNGTWLAEVLPDPTDWFRLAFVLAAAVPDEMPWGHLTAWIRGDADLTEVGPYEQCGTPAGARLHWRRKEPTCQACKNAENERNRLRRQSRPTELESAA